jgi:hypothetical protein
LQAPHGDHVPLSHVLVWFPQLPQGWLAAPVQACPLHASHWQLALHVCVPALPHAWVEVARQSPSPPHADQADHAPLSQTRVCVPQLPQGWLGGPLQVWPVQEPHWQAPTQACIPPVPHARVYVSAHSPSPVHADQSDQTALWHVRVCVPQFPQGCVAAPSHDWFSHVPHWQLPPQPCVPPRPHASTAAGAHVPSPVQGPQSLHTPALHVRVWVPQLPQDSCAPPAHVFTRPTKPWLKWVGCAMARVLSSIVGSASKWSGDPATVQKT